MSDPIEQQWEEWQNRHCPECKRLVGGMQGDYNYNLACAECRRECEDREIDRVEAAREVHWDTKFKESRGE